MDLLDRRLVQGAEQGHPEGVSLAVFVEVSPVVQVGPDLRLAINAEDPITMPVIVRHKL